MIYWPGHGVGQFGLVLAGMEHRAIRPALWFVIVGGDHHRAAGKVSTSSTSFTLPRQLGRPITSKPASATAAESVGPSQMTTGLLRHCRGRNSPARSLHRPLLAVLAPQANATDLAGAVVHRDSPRTVTLCPDEAEELQRLTRDAKLIGQTAQSGAVVSSMYCLSSSGKSRNVSTLDVATT